MLQYFQERFLYRLSKSPYSKHFALKGALLFRIYRMTASRPTIDIDFLGIDTANSEDNMTGIFKKILSLESDDGVSFDLGSIISEAIKEEDEYKGVRLFCVAYLGVAKRRMHFDIGFGDIIVPEPVTLEYPVIIETQPAPKVLAYTPESAIAEKFEAIVSLGYFTSRIKDFYDIFYMAENYVFSSDTLYIAWSLDILKSI
ncbi:MAG: nucleotidyl transferase AbiEii/AbiGii toxin family protein [Candidatus Stygibacter frigidus]|nr:nucleotidyl transferase AbiEii/AbiGii toxin family protein [Candidatus Stygibacter frigidus]